MLQKFTFFAIWYLTDSSDRDFSIAIAQAGRWVEF